MKKTSFGKLHGTFNIDSPQGLQNAVFFYVGKVCCLRGGQEQQELKISQFVRYSNLERYVYNEHGSKNRNGGFYQLSVQNKNVEIHKNWLSDKRCLVSLLDLYFTKLPQAAKAKDLFYCRPLTNYTKDGVWYSEQPRGKHALSDMVKKMCEQAGIEGKFTNHSLRASGATTLFQSDTPEKVIQEFTGHRSVKALRQYEKVATKQKEATCNILTGGTATSSFSTEVEKLQHPQVSESTCPNLSSIPMPIISAQISSASAVNFTVNICPIGNFAINGTCSSISNDYLHLLEGLDIDEFLS